MMKNGKPNHGSGKTYFNRIKSKGESWIALREKAMKNGTFKSGDKKEGEK